MAVCAAKINAYIKNEQLELHAFTCRVSFLITGLNEPGPEHKCAPVYLRKSIAD